MGFRFRKTIGLIPGVRLNLSKGMPSVSVGEKGFSYNIGKDGEKTTVGLPGSGMSYSTKRSKNTSPILIIVMVVLALGVKYMFPDFFQHILHK